jgi:DNA-binding protein H-NS
MKSGKFDFSLLSMDELWTLHEEIGALLSEKITAEKRELEARLSKLNGRVASGRTKISQPKLKVSERRRSRRKYPPVLPKFQNPADPSETWAGRGKQPRWLVSQLKAGKKINDFLIDNSKRQTIAKRRPG